MQVRYPSVGPIQTLVGSSTSECTPLAYMSEQPFVKSRCDRVSLSSFLMFDMHTSTVTEHSSEGVENAMPNALRQIIGRYWMARVALV
jgi:hypothetical protein